LNHDRFTILAEFASVACFQEKNLDWFPRMRAMSLAADDGEGEQNEIRSLQQQLAITNQLVENLSRQLNELKDQVKVFFMFLSLLK
jgi:hypothetical protein